MIIQAAMGYINGHLWVVIVFAVLMFYSLYTLVKNYSAANKIRDRQKTIKKELADLEAKYSEQAAKLEARLKNLKEKLKNKDKFKKGIDNDGGRYLCSGL